MSVWKQDVQSPSKVRSWLWELEREEQWTHRAEFTAADEDPTLIKHTGVQLQHVIDVDSHKVLC